jgi:hypothetical protein
MLLVGDGQYAIGTERSRQQRIVMADKNRKSKATQKQDDVIVPQDDATAHLVQTLVANGQAARANPDGSLPPGVTHEIVGETSTGLPIVRRRRFALYWDPAALLLDWRKGRKMRRSAWPVVCLALTAMTVSAWGEPFYQPMRRQ